MARQYVITEEEMIGLIESLELHALRQANHGDGMRHLEDAWRNLSEKEKNNCKPAIESYHRAFHFVVTRWAQSVGFDGRRR